MNHSATKAILADAQAALAARPDVRNVRLGWVFRDGWITDQRAWVVTQQALPADETRGASEIGVTPPLPLPAEFQGLPVEVTGPTIEDLLREAQASSRGEVTSPLPSSSLPPLPPAPRYVMPTALKLRQYTARMRVAVSVSPDAGWRELSAFLGQARQRLVVGMYDCGAPHIVDALIAVGQQPGFEKLTLVMQRGSTQGKGTKAKDMTDDEAVAALAAALGDKFEHTWVKTGVSSGWVATSYHIKVAVADERLLWLSSGNWQSSNQPAADPVSEQPPVRRWLDKYNRDWHAVIEHGGLARTFAAYLRYDFDNNPATRGEEEEWPELPDLFVAEPLTPRDVAHPVGWRYFAPQDETRRFTVRPLLTPDNYHEHALQLVRDASDELLFQNQTFKAPKGHEKSLAALLEAIREKQRKGVKVRIIFRLLNESDAREVLEGLKDYELNLADVKVQHNCHTKGIIVDRQQVLLGSQNWSNYGVSENRDASLLFKDATLAQYFAEIFQHDWDHLAHQDIRIGSRPVRFASPGEATPPGMVRVSAKEIGEWA